MRTLVQIIESINGKANEKLPAIDTSAPSSLWSIVVHVVAYAIHVFEQIVYHEKQELEKRIEQTRYGGIAWYGKVAKEYQEGGTLVYDEIKGVFEYETDQPDTRIIERASVTEQEVGSNVTVFIKVAKKDDKNELVHLDSDELDTFKSYMNRIKVAGTALNIISVEGDTINGDIRLHYDSSYSQQTVKDAIQEALDAFRDSFSTNGTLLRNDLINVIRGVEGVDDVAITSLKATLIDGTETVIDRSYQTVAGYFNYEGDWINTWDYKTRFDKG